MRTIKFRGKCKNGAWHYGVPVFRSVGNKERCYIVSGVVDVDYDAIMIETWHGVIPETVGQFTGLLDKNGYEVYDNDKILVNGKIDGIVEWDDERRGFIWDFGLDQEALYYLNQSEVEVIGNLHDQ